jgi:hypothetical protein
VSVSVVLLSLKPKAPGNAPWLSQIFIPEEVRSTVNLIVLSACNSRFTVPKLLPVKPDDVLASVKVNVQLDVLEQGAAERQEIAAEHKVSNRDSFFTS